MSFPVPSPQHPGTRPGVARRLLITAGPTHEPIDAVRYLANRSSGRLGIALADAAAARGLHVTLLLGPTHRTPSDHRVRTERFHTTAELQALLLAHFPFCDTLIMAAAVADYRPTHPAAASSKFRRGNAPLTLELEPTPDLLAGVAATKRADQRVVGFALEPQDRLLDSARDKLERKRLDAVVANPLETMDADTITATVLFASGPRRNTPGQMSKYDFAAWLLDVLQG